jgi:hypothetical protein
MRTAARLQHNLHRRRFLEECIELLAAHAAMSRSALQDMDAESRPSPGHASPVMTGTTWLESQSRGRLL